MAVVSVKERHERRRSSTRDGKTTHVRVFLVVTNDVKDGTAIAINAKGVPAVGEWYDARILGSTNGERSKGVPVHTEPVPIQLVFGNLVQPARVTGKDCDPVQGDSNHFDVLVEYTTVDPFSLDEDPLKRPPEFNWGSSETTEPYFMDARSTDRGGPRPVTNSAGDAFEQFLQRERGEMTITMVRNEKTHDAAAADVYSHTTNLGEVKLDGTTFAAGTLKLSPITAQKVTEKMPAGGTVTYYKRTYSLKARHDGWKDHPLDIGFNESTGNKTLNQQNTKPIVDSAGLPIQKPWPLDGHGSKKPNATDTPEELEFEPYTELDWEPLAFK